MGQLHHQQTIAASPELPLQAQRQLEQLLRLEQQPAGQQERAQQWSAALQQRSRRGQKQEQQPAHPRRRAQALQLPRPRQQLPSWLCSQRQQRQQMVQLQWMLLRLPPMGWAARKLSILQTPMSQHGHGLL